VVVKLPPVARQEHHHRQVRVNKEILELDISNPFVISRLGVNHLENAQDRATLLSLRLVEIANQPNCKELTVLGDLTIAYLQPVKVEIFHLIGITPSAFIMQINW